MKFGFTNLMDDVRDPKRWNKFIGKIQLRASQLAASNRSRLGLVIDLGIADDPQLPELRQQEREFYKLARLARDEEMCTGRRQYVVLFHALLYGPEPIKYMARKMLVWQLEEDDGL